MNKIVSAVALLAVSAVVQAKIPPPVLDDAAKAKAAEAAAKTAWTGKSDAYLLCKSQDKVAAYYRKTAGTAAAKDGKPMPASMPAAAAPKPTVAGSTAVPGGTAVSAAGPATPTPCADPGPFAYTPPEQKPLEAAGAHSPPGNASSPPSTRTPAAAMAPAKKS